jgi:hypothetical protein
MLMAHVLLAPSLTVISAAPTVHALSVHLVSPSMVVNVSPLVPSLLIAKSIALLPTHAVSAMRVTTSIDRTSHVLLVIELARDAQVL